MNKKTSPLSDDSIVAQATYQIMLDDLDRCADLIEGSKNKGERVKATACLRSVIANIKEAYSNSNTVLYVRAHEKGRTAAARKGGEAKAAFAHSIIPYLEREWDPIPPNDRQTHEGWLKHNYKRILTDCGYKQYIDNDKVFKRVERWLNPSQRPKS
jgi:hypothetical protein